MALVILGVAVLQAVWIITVPPFRGIDEFDQAFRVSSVSAGSWRPATVAAEHGRGRLIEVQESLVMAAYRECTRLGYTGEDNCNPVEHLPNGRVLVASAATDQSPLFYAVVGAPSRLASGDASLYLMRSCAGMVCLLLFALALWCVGQWARTVWPVLALLMAATPMVIYSSIIPAGNGAEMLAGIGLWCALLGLATTHDLRTERRLLSAAVLACAVLCSLRQLGPPMAVLIVAITAMALGSDRIRSLLERSRTMIVTAVAVAVVATLAQYAWVFWARHYPVGPTAGVGSGTPDIEPPTHVVRTIVWFAQTFAAFPARNEPSPDFVYGILMVLFIATWLAAFKLADLRLRLALGAAAMASLAFPWAVSLGLWKESNWQGRYGIALSAGCILLAGLALDRLGHTPSWARIVVLIVVGLQGLAFTGAVLGVFPRIAPNPSPALVLALTAFGWLLLAVAIRLTACHQGFSTRELARAVA